MGVNLMLFRTASILLAQAREASETLLRGSRSERAHAVQETMSMSRG